MRFEYKFVSDQEDLEGHRPDMETVLNELGAEGWCVLKVWTVGKYQLTSKYLLMREVDSFYA